MAILNVVTHDIPELAEKSSRELFNHEFFGASARNLREHEDQFDVQPETGPATATFLRVTKGDNLFTIIREHVNLPDGSKEQLEADILDAEKALTLTQLEWLGLQSNPTEVKPGNIFNARASYTSGTMDIVLIRSRNEVSQVNVYVDSQDHWRLQAWPLEDIEFSRSSRIVMLE